MNVRRPVTAAAPQPVKVSRKPSAAAARNFIGALLRIFFVDVAELAISAECTWGTPARNMIRVRVTIER